MRQEDETTLDLLRKVPLFADCSPDELRQIAAIADELSFREGKILTRQGGPGREMFILLEGQGEGGDETASRSTRSGRATSWAKEHSCSGSLATRPSRPRPRCARS